MQPKITVSRSGKVIAQGPMYVGGNAVIGHLNVSTEDEALRGYVTTTGKVVIQGPAILHGTIVLGRLQGKKKATSKHYVAIYVNKDSCFKTKYIQLSTLFLQLQYRD